MTTPFAIAKRIKIFNACSGLFTSVKLPQVLTGVFAVGDVRTKALRQVVTAVADGATAVHYAEEYLAGGI